MILSKIRLNNQKRLKLPRLVDTPTPLKKRNHVQTRRAPQGIKRVVSKGPDKPVLSPFMAQNGSKDDEAALTRSAPRLIKDRGSRLHLISNRLKMGRFAW